MPHTASSFAEFVDPAEIILAANACEAGMTGLKA